MDSLIKAVGPKLSLLWSIENIISYILPKFAHKASCNALSTLLYHSSERSHEHRLTIEAICKYQGIAPHGLFNEQLEHMIANIIGNLNICPERNVDLVLISGIREVFDYRSNQYEVTQHEVQKVGLRSVQDCLQQISLEYTILNSELDNTSIQSTDAFVNGGQTTVRPLLIGATAQA